MITTIPFQGFYESIHTLNLDSVFEQMIEDDSGDIVKGLENIDFSYTNEMLVKYCIEYVAAFAKETEIKLVFDSIDSPREYNFATDRIFCEIEENEVERILHLVDVIELKKLVVKKFTSYDGFFSSYDNELMAWGDFRTWDHNQIGTLLECYAKQMDFDELHSMEDANCNGDVSNMVFESLSESDQNLINSVER